MRKILIILIFPLFTIAQNHLLPVQGYFDTYPHRLEYFPVIKKVLFENLSETPSVQFIVTPSFSPEFVVQINQQGDKFILNYNIAKESIWYSKKRNYVKIEKFKKEIQNDVALKLIELYKLCIYQTKYEEEEIFGLDGTNYYFTIFDNGLKSGTIWSPEEESKMGKLVEISDILVDYATDSNIKLDDNFLKKANDLINLLK